MKSGLSFNGYLRNRRHWIRNAASDIAGLNILPLPFLLLKCLLHNNIEKKLKSIEMNNFVAADVIVIPSNTLMYLWTQKIWGSMRLHDVPMMSNRVKRDLRFPAESSVFYSLYILCACMLSCFSLVWLCDPMDSSPPGPSVHGVLKARILEWGAMFSSRGSSWPTSLMSPVLTGRLFTTSTTWKASV